MIGDVTDASTGKAIEGAVVVVRSPALQGEQVGATDASGRYVITLLPPGTYSVHVEATGYKAFDQGNVVIPLAKTIRVNIALAPVAVVAKEVVVTAKQTATVDQGSTTVGVLLEKELLEKIPMGRTFESALIIAPTAIAPRFGAIPAGFGGATGVENTYLVDGINTTSVSHGQIGTTLPPEFLEQLEVKVGGYMPEFGRALGAIINTVVKSGGNEFHGDIFFNYSGSWLRAIAERTNANAIQVRPHVTLATDFGFAVGGPIVKDKLWFFLGFAPAITLTDVNRYLVRRFETNRGTYDPDPADPTNETKFRTQDIARRIWERAARTMRFAAKLTYAPTPDQRIAISYFGDPSNATGPRSTAAAGLNGEPSTFLTELQSGQQNVVVNYFGKFFDKRVQIEASAGYIREITKEIPNNFTAPWMRYQANSILQIPEPGCRQDASMTLATCPVGGDYFTGSLFLQDIISQRGTAGVKISFLLPRNLVKVGADVEWNTYSNRFIYPAGQREFLVPSARRDLNGDGRADAELIRSVQQRGLVLRGPNDEIIPVPQGVTQRSFSRNIGIFLQDSINITDNLTLNAGIRYEIQQLYGSAGPCTLEDDFATACDPDRDYPGVNKLNTVLTLNKNIAPRVGITWDPFKDGRTKVYGSYGIFYESVPLDLGLRALGREDIFARTRRTFADTQLGAITWFGGHPTGIQTDLEPQYIHEFILGVEHEVIPSYRIGLSYLKRNLGSGFEDLSVDDASTYFIGNPGKGPTGASEAARLAANPGALLDSRCRFRDPEAMTGPGCAGDFPELVREYDAYTLYFEKRRTEDQPWQFKFSYTWSLLHGNYPGLFSPDNGQLDPNINTQFDLPRLVANRLGPLPDNRTHQIKFFGSYEFPKKWLGNHSITIGIGLTAESGSPFTPLGADEDYQESEAFALPRGALGETPWIISPDLFFEWGYQITKDVRIAFNAVIFNFANLQEPLRVDQDWTFDPICPLRRNPAVSARSQLDGLTVGEIDRSTGNCVPTDTPVTKNPNFGSPIVRQAPISARLGLKLTF
jgi:outer membrane receptor protein involved in Fe transport